MASFLVRAIDHSSSPPPPPDDPALVFTAGGDIGAGGDTDDVLAAIGADDGEFFLALGDLSYSRVEPESAWCDHVKGYLGSEFPVQLIVGNHEDDDRVDGFIGDFAACLPDRMNSTGVYGAEYFFDVDGLVRVIMIGAGNDVDGVRYDYEVGTDGYAWLSDTIDDARLDGIPWVVVGVHKPCLTAGAKACEVGVELADLLIDKRVDLVLSGHDHNYQRSGQLDCLVLGSFDSSCVVDDGIDGVYPRGEGTVFVVSGVTGAGFYAIDPDDPEYPYLAASMGGGDPLEGSGYFRVTVSDSALTGTFVGVTSPYTDTFTIG
jgi:hypothetical protein